MSNVIAIENLSKTYRRSWGRQPVAALKNVSLKVGEGEGIVEERGDSHEVVLSMVGCAVSDCPR